MAVLQAEVAALQDANAELRHRLRESDARLTSASAEASRRTEEANAAHGEYPPIPWRGCGSSLTSPRPRVCGACVYAAEVARLQRLAASQANTTSEVAQQADAADAKRQVRRRVACVVGHTHTHTHTKTHTHTEYGADGPHGDATGTLAACSEPV